jgi:PTH2 family peptidyl-tRNA hydrolase
MIWLSQRIREPDYGFNEAEWTWLEGSFIKVCIRVDSEQDLLEVVRAAEEVGVLAHLCVDAGQTEFLGVSTPTCGAIGPDFADRIDAITGHLKLL